MSASKNALPRNCSWRPKVEYLMGETLVVAVEVALRAVVKGNKEEALAALQQVAFSPPRSAKRTHISRAVMLSVFSRDNFRCRYCRRLVVLGAALRLLSERFPDLLQYHPHGKRDSTHPVYYEILASCDHVLPVSRGGTADEANLVTACARCQFMKSDWLLEELRWTMRPIEPGWDGLSASFAEAMVSSPVESQELKAWAATVGR